jgi:calcium/calmodulin-dependent protein kinase I
VDLWSVGVVTYVLLCGYPPFYGTTQIELFEKITHAKYEFPEPEWNYISDTAKDFIKKLLVLDPKDRMTADQALEHPFLSSSSSSNNKLLSIETTMNKYNQERKKARATKLYEES